MVGNWHLQFVSINFVPHFYIDREKSPQKELLHSYSSHTVIRVKIVNDCSILKWVTSVLDTIWTLPRCMPRKTKETQYSCHIRTHHYNSRSCKAFAVGHSNLFHWTGYIGSISWMRHVEIAASLVSGRVLSMNKYVYFPFNMLLNVARTEAKLVHVATTRDVWEVFFI